MGNQLVAYAPSLIRPAEHYLAEVPDLTFDTNLGSTRFLKVCRAKMDNVLCVVKIFVIHEQSVPIKTYCEKITDLKVSLTSSPSPNCLPFVDVIITPSCVMLLRRYIKYSLYDRLSTRPFIVYSEKLWLAFQLLYGLCQIHKHGLCHGDLKLENILVTPGLRLLLSDFAPFKPVFLPRNNPATLFDFFFDTAGRRCCYVAPERFKNDSSVVQDNLLCQDEAKEVLTPSMDIFSAGCCLIELFTEGKVPFDLSQLLAFSAGNYHPGALVKEIEDINAQELVNHMIQRDPTDRLTAEEYLSQFRGKLFPEVFYSTLQSYFDILALQPITRPDSRTERLCGDVRNFPTGEKASCLSLIFTSLVTAEIRGLTTVTCKILAVDTLYSLSQNLPDEAILERVIPYVLYMCSDKSSHIVRAKAIGVLVDCLDLVKKVPPSDYNLFSAYIFPAIEKLDRDVAVRIAVAKNIARLCEISRRYSETSLAQSSTDTLQNSVRASFLAEYNSQKQIIQSILSQILTDTDSIVKRTLVETPGSLESLCSYFGPSKSHDLLLSHLITFLNYKGDFQLRIAFFKRVPIVASFIGWHAGPLLVPLLKQGLADEEEFVIRETILCIRKLIEMNFFNQRLILDLLEEISIFLIHPNLWLRNASVGVVKSVVNSLSEVDVYCKVTPRIKAYLNCGENVNSRFSCGHVFNEVSILSRVKPCMSRQVFESCARAKSSVLSGAVHFLLKLLKSTSNNLEPDETEIKNFIARLKAEGLNLPLDPIYLTFLEHHVIKINTQRCLRSETIGNSTGTFSPSVPVQQPQQQHLLIISTPPIKESHYAMSSSISHLSPTSASNFTPAFEEKARGVLVAHLHEHRSSIFKIQPLTKHKGLFATASRDEVRIWDAVRMEGKNIANRSRCNIKFDRVICNMSYVSGSSVMGMLDSSTTLHGYSLEEMNANRLFSICISHSGKEDLGYPVALESGPPNLFLAGTDLGYMIGYDLRMGSKEALRLRCDLKSGLLTCLTCDMNRNWLCTGSSKGVLTCWDLRFSIPVNTIKTDACIRKVKASPFHPWGVFSASRAQNEVSLWNLETGSRHLSLWASSSPPLTKLKEGSCSKVEPSRSMFGIEFVPSQNAVLTCGNDLCLRWWDLNCATYSSILVSPDKLDQNSAFTANSFKFRLVDGVEVFHDTLAGSPRKGSKGLNDTTVGGNGTAVAALGNAHHNIMTDVATVAASNQSFIITSSSDGVIKLWK